MRLIVASNRPVVADVQRVLNVFRIVGSLRHDGRCIRCVIDDFRPRIGSLELEVVGVTFGQLDGQAMVDRVRGAFERDDAIDPY